MPPQDENQNQSADRYIGLFKTKTRISSWDDFGQCPCPVGFFDFVHFRHLYFLFVLFSVGMEFLRFRLGMELVGTFYIFVLLGIDCIAYFGLDYRILLRNLFLTSPFPYTEYHTCHYVVDKVRNVSTKIQIHFTRSILMLIFILGSW